MPCRTAVPCNAISCRCRAIPLPQQPIHAVLCRASPLLCPCRRDAMPRHAVPRPYRAAAAAVLLCAVPCRVRARAGAHANAAPSHAEPVPCLAMPCHAHSFPCRARAVRVRLRAGLTRCQSDSPPPSHRAAHVAKPLHRAHGPTGFRRVTYCSVWRLRGVAQSHPSPSAQAPSASVAKRYSQSRPAIEAEAVHIASRRPLGHPMSSLDALESP